MKVLMLLFSLVIFENGCSQSKINQDTLLIEYSALSRGSYKLISVNKKEVSVINKREGKPIILACNKTNWNNLMDALKTINIENISQLEAPSQKRLFDGAAIANLKITYNGTIYESNSFDHGNPPKELEILVKEILSISESID